MKGKKKPKGTKAEIRAYKKRSRRIGTAVMVAIIVSVIAFSSFLIYHYLIPSKSNDSSPTTLELKAAIVDQLSLTLPNLTFIETATNILEKANYTVDYYPGEEVTVGFYRNLPTHGYTLIILRVHSSATSLQGEEFVKSDVIFFTSETYSTSKYFWEQQYNQLGKATYAPPDPPYYFSIHPGFVASRMNGKFQNTAIIMMGCEGLSNTSMAEALIKRGVEVYIGWSGDVSGSHTDKATIQLLKRLITENQTIKQAVTETMNEVGPDPIDKSILLYYPDTSADNYVIPNITSSLILSDANFHGYDSIFSTLYSLSLICKRIITLLRIDGAHASIEECY